MKKISILFFALLTIVTFSCNTSSEKNKETISEPKAEGEIRDELYQEVIEIHDIAMLKMQTIMDLKGKAISEADSLRNLENEALTSRIELLEKTQIALEEANKSMMVWMREFRPLSDTVNHEQAMEYLRAEQDKITEVNDRMDQAIKEAGEL